MIQISKHNKEYSYPRYFDVKIDYSNGILQYQDNNYLNKFHYLSILQTFLYFSYCFYIVHAL